MNMNMNIPGDKDLFNFLANAPKEFRDGEKIKKYQLKNGDYIHCVLWNMHFYVTGTDIVKVLVWRFNNAGRQITSPKKFEEGVFSDLRNLKPGIDATLERPRSEFLEFLYKNGCIRTQKKQKVFFWYSVPHDALFCDALDRDLRRETSYYSYSKYMNNFAPAGMIEQMEFNHLDNPQYTPPPGSLMRKKNSVKMATRKSRSPKDNMVSTEFQMHNIQKMPHDLLAPSLPLEVPDEMALYDYTSYPPSGMDPFVSFEQQGAYNFNYSDIGFGDEMNINNIEYDQFSSPDKMTEPEKIYGMPELYTTQNEEMTDETGYISNNRNYAQNIPSAQGKPQK